MCPYPRLGAKNIVGVFSTIDAAKAEGEKRLNPGKHQSHWVRYVGKPYGYKVEDMPPTWYLQLFLPTPRGWESTGDCIEEWPLDQP